MYTEIWELLIQEHLVLIWFFGFFWGEGFEGFYFFYYNWFVMFCQFPLYIRMTQDTHTHTHTFFFSHYPPSCSITMTRYSCLCYTAGSHCLSTPNAVVCINNPKLPVHSTPSFSPLATTGLFSKPMGLFIFCRKVHLCCLLGSRT